MSRADALRRLASDPAASTSERASARRVLLREGTSAPVRVWASASSAPRMQLVLYAARHHGVLAVSDANPARRGLWLEGADVAVRATIATCVRLRRDLEAVMLEAAVGFLAGALPVDADSGDTRAAPSPVVSAAYGAGAALNPAPRLEGS